MNPELYTVLNFGTWKEDVKTVRTNRIGSKEMKNSQNYWK